MSIWLWLRGKAFRTIPNESDGIEAGCPGCGAGNAKAARRALRIGEIYACRRCKTSWYVRDNPPIRVKLTPDDMPMIEKWNAAPQALDKKTHAVLRKIGPSPTHPSPPTRQTPCAVTTLTGGHFPCAIICEQNYPPFWLDGRKWRFADEIAEVSPSPFALPLDVRTATFHAPEIQKNYRPSLIVMPDGHYFEGEGPEVFMVHPDYDATEARMAERSEVPADRTIGYVPLPEEIVYFAAERGKPKELLHNASFNSDDERRIK